MCEQLDAAAYSKVDGVYNPFVRPDPIHICKVHEHEDPLVQFMHEEFLKFGNVTKVKPRIDFSGHSYKLSHVGLSAEERRLLLPPQLHS